MVVTSVLLSVALTCAIAASPASATGACDGFGGCIATGVCRELGVVAIPECVCAAGYNGVRCDEGTLAGNVVGCFQNNATSLNNAVVLACPNAKTCSTACRQLGFLYAGLSNGIECLCGDSISGGSVAADRCNQTCLVDGVSGCGGPGLSLVYNAGYQFFPFPPVPLITLG